jgi:hypothetical protein
LWELGEEILDVELKRVLPFLHEEASTILYEGLSTIGFGQLIKTKVDVKNV